MSCKMRAFMTAFKMYTFTLFWVTKAFNAGMNFALSKLPDSVFGFAQQPTNVDVVIAKKYSIDAQITYDVTNAVKLFLNFYWDKEACDENGGISLTELKNIIGNCQHGFLWICYLLKEAGINPTDPPEVIIPKLKYMFVDLGKEIIYRYGALNIPSMNETKPIDIMFNQVSFNPDFEW